MSFSGILVVDGISAFFAINHLDNAEEAMQREAENVEDYARENAPWTDQTGSARAGLIAEAERQGTELVLTLAHSVDYGVWLEVIQNGRFAIIMPTLEHFGPEVAHRAGRGFVTREG